MSILNNATTKAAQEDVGDGVALYCVPHPTLPWYHRLWWWITGRYRLDPNSLEEVEVDLWQWQWIGSAPKDGTCFLSKDTDGNISVGWWQFKYDKDNDVAVRDLIWDRYRQGEVSAWTTREEWDRLVVEHTPQVDLTAGFWTSEHHCFDGVQERAVLIGWCPLPDY